MKYKEKDILKEIEKRTIQITMLDMASLIIWITTAWVILVGLLVQFLIKEKELRRIKQKLKNQYKNYEVNTSR